MKIEILSSPKVICANRRGIHNYFAWPTVARLPGGALSAVCSGFRIRHADPFGKAVICYSFNEGITWTPPAVALDTPLDDRDVGILTFGDQVMLTTCNHSVATQKEYLKVDQARRDADPAVPFYDTNREEDRRRYAESYLDYTDVEKAEAEFLGSLYAISHDGGFSFGPVQRLPVSAPHGPAAAPDGRVVYVGHKFDPTDCSRSADSLECFITDEAGQFRFTGSIPPIADTFDGLIPQSCEPHAIVLPNGEILVHFRAQTGYSGNPPRRNCFTLYESRSTDGGKTFSQPRMLLDEPLLGAPAHLLRLSNGILISTWGVRSKPYGIKAIFSLDEGRTWSTPEWIYDNGGISGDLGYPASVELADGSILTVFYAHPEPGAPDEILQLNWRLC